MELKRIPATLTCTQVAQKCHHAVKFNDLLFEKAVVGKTKKRHVSGFREDFSATPPFALKTTKDNLQILTNHLNAAGKAALLCGAIASNDFQPSTSFETSNTLRLARSHNPKDLCNDLDRENIAIETVVNVVFQHIAEEVSSITSQEKLYFDNDTAEKIRSTLCIDTEKSKEICVETKDQSDSKVWYAEGSKRIITSIFGKIMNRKKSLHPTSLIKSVLQKGVKPKSKNSCSLKVGFRQ
eukprot:gene11636-12835_t